MTHYVLTANEIDADRRCSVVSPRMSSAPMRYPRRPMRLGSPTMTLQPVLQAVGDQREHAPEIGHKPAGSGAAIARRSQG
jgi:hypothetical protein